MELNEILRQRRESLSSLRAKGISLYTAKVPTHIFIKEARDRFQEGRKASLCGRVMAKRLHGKAAFLDLRDSTGKLQAYFKADILGEQNWAIFQEVDIADILAVGGELFKTHTGELSIKVEEFVILTKSLQPLPEKWHGLKDTDLRYRKRYLDLIVNEELRRVFKQRTQIIQAIRKFLDNRGFQEVETPMLHPIPGGAAGRPFKTTHNEYKLDLYLRIAPELYLKRLLVGGLDRVYELNRSFRNEGISRVHNPEFTMLEVYCAYADYEDMMQLVQDLIINVAKKVLGRTDFTYQGKTIDLNPPWQRRSFENLVKEKFGILPEDQAETMLKKLKEKGFAREATKLTRSQVAKVIEEVLEAEMDTRPTFVTDYFTDLCPLAKAKKDNPLISERFELYIAGLEIANAYSELNDPLEQEERFRKELKELQDDKRLLDEDYILALEHGMPPAGGLGVGIDRLVMLLTDQPSIRDVILFPLLRPEPSLIKKTGQE
ncbi:MAG: lysine--tRNA ligase [Candidatus Omnitrophica bacterium]|nr:lysine--tRNA ligase [Candidatus Omnitrophota bacterium]